MVLGLGRLQNPGFACGSAARPTRARRLQFRRRTDTLMCAHAAEACGLAAAARPARHRRGAAQRRPYSPAQSRRPPGVVKRYALAASPCLVVVQVPIKGALMRETASSRKGLDVGLFPWATSRRRARRRARRRRLRHVADRLLSADVQEGSPAPPGLDASTSARGHFCFRSGRRRARRPPRGVENSYSL